MGQLAARLNKLVFFVVVVACAASFSGLVHLCAGNYKKVNFSKTKNKKEINFFFSVFFSELDCFCSVATLVVDINFPIEKEVAIVENKSRKYQLNSLVINDG